MEYRRFGRTELEVSSISLGCVTFGREIDRDASFAVLDHARERGINCFDTAEAYAAGASETVLGDWLASRGVRDEIVLATKVAGSLTRERVLASVNESLKRLKTEVIDLFQLHNWDDEVPLEETLAALQSLEEQGKVRFCGVSNWSAWQVAKALLLSTGKSTSQAVANVVSVQPPYSLVAREIESDLLPLCCDQGVATLTYSPLGAGFLTGKYRRGGEVPRGTRFDVIPGHQPIYFTDRGFQVVDGLREIAAQEGRTMHDLALAWVLTRPDVTSVLIGAREPAHIDQAFAAGDRGLSTEVRTQLESL